MVGIENRGQINGLIVALTKIVSIEALEGGRKEEGEDSYTC